MPHSPALLLYGATGYTGRLVARMARDAGLAPILSGRDATALAAMGAELSLPVRPATLDDPAALDHALDGVRAVLHCAGPFAHTWRPMADACLRAKAHYLDITGELEVFEALAARGTEAERAGVMFLPGVGFDVVPSDCLASHLAHRLPGATHLALAFKASGRASRGTAITMVEGRHRGGAVRRGGRIVRVPPAWRTRTVPFRDGPASVTTIAWGDVSTAFHSTGIPDVEVYTALPPSARRALRLSRWLAPLLALPPVQAWQKRAIRRRPEGPDDAQLQHGSVHLWGEAHDATGRRVEARMQGPNGYLLTAHAALHIAGRVLAGEHRPGFTTPSLLFGPDLVLELPGIVREDLA